MRCNRCGNDNPETNRFCGSCGASLLASAVPPLPVRSESASQASTGRSPVAPIPAAPRTAAPASEEEVPAISGPSFLGLNAPASRHSDRGSSLGLGSQSSRTSGNLDYLLDDDDEPKSGAGKIFLILIALALAVSFGYLRWRHEGLSSLMSGWQKPSAARSSDSSQPSPSAGTPSSPPDSSAAPSQPTPTPSQSAATQTAPAPGADSSPSAGTTASTGTTADASAPGANSSGTPAGSPAPDGAPASAAADSPPADRPAAKTATKEEVAGAADSAEPDPNEKPVEPTPKHPARSPSIRKPSAALPLDQVAEAEKYVYGRGTRQDCDRGLRMLRPAAEQSNPRAMISLGALYSTGVCTPRDLPTAYRWFALALRKQPDNQPLQENLQRLWAQMTVPERQLAIKLSQ